MLEQLTGLIEPIAGTISIIATTVSLFAGGIGFYLFGQVRKADRRNTELRAEKAKAETAETTAIAERDEAKALLAEIVKLVDGETDIWRRKPVTPPDGHMARTHRSIPIMLLANLKGGVGKTTLAGNLAAHFDALGEAVLLIDLDYQGSLSAMALRGDTRKRALDHPGAMDLLGGKMPKPIQLPGFVSGSGLIDCYYPVFNQESRVIFQWMMGGTEDDVRYRLAALLHDGHVQTHYDRVIIDTGPRVTLGMVNGLCAATHLLVPTQLNGLSIEAMNSFLFTFDDLKAHLELGIKQYRIVGMQKAYDTAKLIKAEIEAIRDIERLLANRGEPAGLFLRDTMIPDQAAFKATAGRSITYLDDRSVRAPVDALGAEIARMAPSYAEEPQ